MNYGTHPGWIEVITGSNDEDTYTIRVIQRLAKRSGERVE